MYDFKSLRSATRLVGHVRKGEATSALVVGAGLIGIELALLLTELGVATTVLESEGWVMPRLLDPLTAAVVETAVAARGVMLRTGTPVVRFEGTGTVSGIRLGSGERITADLVIAATGVKPHTEFLAGSAVEIGWGIRVDDHLETSAPDVYAAGDVAETADWLTGKRYVHAIFPNAVAQARVAATNILGGDVTYQGAEAMNSLKHLGVPVIAMGTTEEPHEVLRTQDRTGLRSVYLREGRLIGAQLAGDTRAAGIYHALMMRRADVSGFGERLVSPSFTMADVVWDIGNPGLANRRTVARAHPGRRNR